MFRTGGKVEKKVVTRDQEVCGGTHVSAGPPTFFMLGGSGTHTHTKWGTAV